MAISPQPLVLYKAVPKTHVQDCIDNNLLAKEGDWWYIGFRQCPQQALYRATQVGEAVDKCSHAILKVEFSPLGVAHFATTFEDESYQFQPVLHKICKKWHTSDWGVWHFTRDLPLSLSDAQGNELVSSSWHEIM